MEQIKGEFRDGLPNGQGVLAVNDMLIIGTFKNGTPDGKTKIIHFAGYYEGDIKEGVLVGEVTLLRVKLNSHPCIRGSCFGLKMDVNTMEALLKVKKKELE